MDDCLTYFRAVIADPKSVELWSTWWQQNEERVRAQFSHEEFLRLKFRKLDGVRRVLVDRGIIEDDGILHRSPRAGDEHCPHCGERLLWVVPGGDTTFQQILEFGSRAGWDDGSWDGWVHHGVYCSNGCTYEMHEYARPE